MYGTIHSVFSDGVESVDLSECCLSHLLTTVTFAEIKRLVTYFRKLKGFEFEGKSIDALLHASIDKDTFKRALQVPTDSEVRRCHAPATLT